MRFRFEWAAVVKILLTQFGIKSRHYKIDIITATYVVLTKTMKYGAFHHIKHNPTVLQATILIEKVEMIYFKICIMEF